jgi:hypothetical protein
VMIPRRPWWLWATAGLIVIPNVLILVSSVYVVSVAVLTRANELRGMSGPGVMGSFMAPIPAFLILRCEWYAVARGRRSATRWIIGLAFYFMALGIIPAVVGSLELAALFKPKSRDVGGESLVAAAVLWAFAVPIALTHLRWQRLLTSL